jgi:AraC-like DNA-binding protein
VAALLWTAYVYRRLSELTRERLSGSLLGRLLAERLPVVLALEQGGTTPWQTYMPLNPFFASGNPVLDDIAGALGIGRDELSQYIHQTLGTNLVAWVSEQRLLYSASQLEQGGRKISEIAAVCGYNDLPTFTRAFKRQFGMAPSEYRKQGKDA